MRAVLQRVAEASVCVEDEVVGEIGGPGLLVFLGIEKNDGPEDLEWLSQKIPSIRLFPDENGLMNRSVLDVGGGILVISQFTLYGNLRKGTRPSFNRAAPPEIAVPLYREFIKQIAAHLGKPVATGEFGKMMKIQALNDGPVTLLLDTKNKRL